MASQNLISFIKASFKNPQEVNLIPGSKKKASFISVTYLSKKGKLKSETFPCAHHLTKSAKLTELIIYPSEDESTMIVGDPTKGRQAIDTFTFD